ncbi:MAG: hypothetical protein U0X91_27340 [Spirosomataceae bacterium]
MKKSFRIIALPIVSVLYCFLLSFYSGSALTYRAAYSNLSESHSKSCSAFPVTDLICHVTQVGVPAPSFTGCPPSLFRSLSNALLAWVYRWIQAFFSIFSQYLFYSQNLLIRLRQPDIIFPFHYFP